jgi:S-DNA-T family DNA segregation ATPase FtsK/SpoIIIE
MVDRSNPGRQRPRETSTGISPDKLEVLGLLVLGFVIVFLIGILDYKAKNLMGIFVHDGVEPLIGRVGLYVLPPALALLGLSLLYHRDHKMINAFAQYGLFLVLLILPITNLTNKIILDRFYHPDDDQLVGILGASIGSLMEVLFGKTGGLVVLGIFGLILLPSVTGYAPNEVLKGIVHLAKFKRKDSEKETKRSRKGRRGIDDIFPDEFDSLPGIQGLIDGGQPNVLEEIEIEISKEKAEKKKTKEKKKEEIINPEETEQMEFNFKKMLRDSGEFQFPTLDLLNAPTNQYAEDDRKALAKKIEETLASYGVEARVEKMVVGPVIIQCELRPAPGVRVNAIKNLRSELAMALAAKTIRIEAPIPGKDVMGIEFPNSKKKIVSLRELIDSEEFTSSKSLLTICIGKDLAGKPIIEDLAKMPHVLIAGQTGAGKSVCLNSIIMSLLYKTAPDEVKLILIDPKRVEMTLYEGLPHLIVPVVQEWADAKNSLIWVAKEMSHRLERLQKSRCRDIATFNKKRPNGEFMQFIVIIIDEFATLMDLAPGKEVERLINHLARLARATGIHIILATQRPDVKVITGSIKANIPARIAFSVPAQVDSKTILDRTGADLLLGEGDMLYRGPRDGSPRRAQGSFVTDDEIEKVVGFLMEQIEPAYMTEIFQDQGEIDELGIAPADDDDDVAGFEDDAEDEMYFQEALKIALRKKRISASLLQREFRIGYNRASRIIDKLEEQGIISGMDGQRSRRLIEGNDFIDHITDP